MKYKLVVSELECAYSRSKTHISDILGKWIESGSLIKSDWICEFDHENGFTKYSIWLDVPKDPSFLL